MCIVLVVRRGCFEEKIGGGGLDILEINFSWIYLFKINILICMFECNVDLKVTI